MIKRFVQCACMALALCMLLATQPLSGFTQESAASSASAQTSEMENGAPASDAVG